MRLSEAADGAGCSARLARRMTVAGSLGALERRGLERERHTGPVGVRGRWGVICRVFADGLWAVWLWAGGV